MYPNDQPQLISPQKPHTLRRIILIVGTTLIAIGVGLHVYKLANAPTCFTASDYVEFYKSAPEGVTFEPGTDFFSASYDFIPGTVQLSTGDSNNSLAKDTTDLGNFYKKHTGKQAVFTIEAAYASSAAEGKSLAEKRVASIKQSLIDAGIPGELITTKVESYDLTDEAIEYDAVDAATLTVASTGACHE